MKKASYLLLFALSVFLFAGCSSVRKSIFNLGLSIERCRSDLDYRTLSVDGQRYAYLEREGDGDTIILLHGFAANKDSWIRFVRYLPLSYRVIVLDMPGHGDSRLDMNQTYTVEYVTAGVATIIDNLGLDRFKVKRTVRKTVHGKDVEPVLVQPSFEAAQGVALENLPALLA